MKIKLKVKKEATHELVDSAKFKSGGKAVENIDSIKDTKTYKIKNHDSGKTYSVKAVNYTDAKKKYNKHILKDAASFEGATITEGPYKGYKVVIQWTNIKGKKMYDITNGLNTIIVSHAELSANQHSLSKDSITEDAKISEQQVKQLTDRLKIKTNLGVSINKETKRVMLFAYSTEQANKWIDKLRAANYKADLHRESGNVHVAKFIMPELKTDSLTEDANLTGKIVKYNGMTVKVLRKLTEQEKQRRAHAANPDAGDYYEVETTSKAVGATKFIVWEARLRDSLTEDADIAQNDIKSTFLPSEANADNIKYVGFNELRKISFYEYDSRYFAHHDLEGRTEEVDKAAVQAVLKKNLIGEVKEEELMSNASKTNEAVSDAFEDSLMKGNKPLSILNKTTRGGKDIILAKWGNEFVVGIGWDASTKNWSQGNYYRDLNSAFKKFESYTFDSKEGDN